MNTRQHCPTVFTCRLAPTSTLSHCIHLSSGTHVNTVPLCSLVVWHPRQHCPTVFTCRVTPTSTVPLYSLVWHPPQHCPIVFTCRVAPTSTLSHCIHLSCDPNVNTVPLCSLVVWHPRQHCPTVFTCVAPTSILSPMCSLVVWHPRQHCPTVFTCRVAPTLTRSHRSHLLCGTYANTIPS